MLIYLCAYTPDKRKVDAVHFLGFTRIETRVVSCIRAFFFVAWILWFMFRSHLHVNFPAFSAAIMQTNFIFQQIKLHVQKSENQAPQNYQSMFTEVTSFEEVKLSYTRASKFQPLAWMDILKCIYIYIYPIHPTPPHHSVACCVCVCKRKRRSP